MLLPEARIDKTLEETLARALGEFCPAWKIASDCSPVDPFDPSHWATDTQSCQVTLRHRVTGRLTVLGRRIADEPSTRLHRGVALSHSSRHTAEGMLIPYDGTWRKSASRRP